MVLCRASFENEALENEDRNTKHPNLENEAPKTRKREKFQVAALLLLILTLTEPPNTWKSEYLFLGRYTVDLFTHFKARSISQTSRFDIPS